ncbi:MAG: prolyl oligopeptidase family serine peptidase [Desulfobacterales bacterium]|nr:prolyl oligopeptidase family serine peptidase [Desulfobacterales bacterium]
MPQESFTYLPRGKDKIRMRYLRFLPACLEENNDKKWPLILFMHGAGERGHDPDILKKHGIPKIVETRPDFGFITISPQCEIGASWDGYIETLEALLDETVLTLPVDTGRVYLTGISMGGQGVWRLAVEIPDRFAALVPICGYGPPTQGFPERVCMLKDVPVWVFHGADDDIVPLEESRKMVAALEACGGNVRFTIYPDTGHDSWTRTYDNPELYQWLLKHDLSEKTRRSEDQEMRALRGKRTRS